MQEYAIVLSFMICTSHIYRYINSGPCIFTIPSFCGFVKNKISVVYGIIIIHAISKLYFVMHKLNIWTWNKLVHCNSMFIQGRNYKYLTSITLIYFFLFSHLSFCIRWNRELHIQISLVSKQLCESWNYYMNIFWAGFSRRRDRISTIQNRRPHSVSTN